MPVSPDAESGGTRKRTCATCGEEFSHDPGSRQRYCARGCRPSAQKEEVKLHVKSCPVCGNNFKSRPSVRQKYCSPTCRRSAENQRERDRDAARAARLGEAPPTQHTVKKPALPRRASTPDLPPTATRNCPHCDQPITIVALLATPEAARPTIPSTSLPEVSPIRRA